MRTVVKVLLAVVIVLVPWLMTLQQEAQEAMLPLLGQVIVVDPGHGGVDPGALGPRGTHEKDIVLGIGLELRTLLRSAGAVVVMTRETDTDLSDPSLGNQYSRRKNQDLARRVELIKDSGAELVLSIHVNSIASARWRGAQTFYSKGSEEGKLLATLVQASLKEVLGNTQRLSAPGDYYIINESLVPSVLVEVGFISNREESELLMSSDYQAKVAWAIFTGVLRYLSTTK